MKLQWIPSTTLSLLRTAHWVSRRRELKDTSLQQAITEPVHTITERLMSASVDPAIYWDHLIEEVVAHDNDVELTPAICEIALLRGGHSDLQSDQVALAIYRGLETCRRAHRTRSPKLADQLRLRYAPLKQAFEAYGPGLVRTIGKQIWNGSPPTDWWPRRVSVHAVQPIATGAAGASGQQTSVWIEAVLTDIDPDVPEWLRLVYQLTQMAITSHTRTHSGSGSSGSGDAKSPGELPWTTAIVPLVLHTASEGGMIPAGELPIEKALSMWHSDSILASATLPASTQAVSTQAVSTQAARANVVRRWWDEVGCTGQPMPVALKQLAAALAAIGPDVHPNNVHPNNAGTG